MQAQWGVRDYIGSEKLDDNVALITGGDRGMGARSPCNLQKKARMRR